MNKRDVTISLTVPEALYALAALGRAVVTAKSLKSDDEWLDGAAVGLYEAAQRKLETALYPEPARHFRGDWEDVPVAPRP